MGGSGEDQPVFQYQNLAPLAPSTDSFSGNADEFGKLDRRAHLTSGWDFDGAAPSPLLHPSCTIKDVM